MQNIQVAINGKKHQFTSEVKLTEVLENLGFADKKIAIELNQAIYSKNQLTDLVIHDGDVLEIITAVGGG